MQEERKETQQRKEKEKPSHTNLTEEMVYRD